MRGHDIPDPSELVQVESVGARSLGSLFKFCLINLLKKGMPNQIGLEGFRQKLKLRGPKQR